MGFTDAEELSTHTPVYFYRFDWSSGKYGAFHALDIPFVFGNRDLNSKFTKKVAVKGDDADSLALAEKMMSYDANFARTGNPNGPGLPDWPKYTVEKKERIYFNNQIKVAPISQKDLVRQEFFNEQRRKNQDSGKK
jgi:para-nitrobenzyl esterase